MLKKNGSAKKGGSKNKGNGSNKNKGGNVNKGQRPKGSKGKGQKGKGKGMGPSKGKGKPMGSAEQNKENMEDKEDNSIMDQDLIDEIMKMSDEELLLAAKNVLTLGCIQKSYGDSCKLYIMDTIQSQYPTPEPPLQVDPVILGDIHGEWLTAQPIGEPQTHDGPYPEFPPDSPNADRSRPGTISA